MQITHLHINGLSCPLGFALPNLRCSWQIRDTLAKRPHSARVEVASDPAFQHLLYCAESDGSDCTGFPLPVTLAPRTRYWLRVQVQADNGDTASAVTWFETGKMSEPWLGKWITPAEEDLFHPLFETRFTAGQAVQARLYIAGLGLYAARLNGKDVGDEVLTPYYSDYHTECQVQTYDITALLQKDNLFEVVLGNGWYKGRFGLGNRKENFGSRFQMIAELHILYLDGHEQVIASDTSWSYRGSDIAASDIYDGETLDRLLWAETPNPLRSAFHASYQGQLTDRYSLPVREQETIPVQHVLYTPAGETVLDFGQNFAGYVAFSARFPRDEKIVLDFGEILQDGNFYNQNYRSAKSRFVYISDGRTEWVRPHFTFFGFRYVRVTGWPGTLDPQDFAGKALYSSMEQTGWIQTGHAGINRLFSNALWGQKSNSIDFPTDCPQRDERLGWSGDAQVFSETASYNMDTAAFYSKFLHDLRLEQRKLDGILPGMIPVFDPKGVIFSSVWGDLATILPSVLYEHFGDKAALARDYPMMRDWVNRIDREDAARGRQYLYNFGDQLGDWLALDGRTAQSSAGGTDPYFIASCYYAHSAQLTARAAAVLGYQADAERYQLLEQQIRSAILEEYFAPSGRLCIDTQTAYVVALAFGIWRDREVLIRDLRARLYQDNFKLTGGFVGAPLLCHVLAENGMAEEAWYFLLQRDYPGWMHCIDLGATTIWERWNSVLDDGHLSGTIMNSLNHYAYGAVVDFLYRDAAGLRPLAAGFARAEIAPCPDPRVGFLDLQYRCPYGVYRCRWEICSDGSLQVLVEVPFGCTARLSLPDHPQAQPLELTAGSYSYHYQPLHSPWAFGRHTPFKELMDRPDALEALGAVSPRLKRHLEAKDPEFLNETIATLKNLPPYMGFTDTVLDQLAQALDLCWKPKKEMS